MPEPMLTGRTDLAADQGQGSPAPGADATEILDAGSIGGPSRTRQGVVFSASYSSGPLPPPAILRELDAIIPGAAAQLFANSLQQSNDRRANEKKVVQADIEARKLGMKLGALLSGMGIVAGSIVASLGQRIAGAAIAGTTAVALATSYLTALAGKSRELAHKHEVAEKLQASPPRP